MSQKPFAVEPPSSITKNSIMLGNLKTSFKESASRLTNKLKSSTNDEPLYSSLPPAHESPYHDFKPMRLLKILPGLPSKPIRCELGVFNLTNAPPFEALSYVWGNPNPPDRIVCNGQAKSVTPNLGAAMRRLRLLDRERLVWIDAICVNQEDLKERSEQVKLMEKIYTKTWRVIVWLGENDGQASTAFSVMNSAAEYCALELDYRIESIGSPCLDPIVTEAILSEYKSRRTRLPNLDSENWLAVKWFYSRPWFRRIWVVQEVSFSATLMYIGDLEIDWKVVAAAALWLWQKNYQPVGGLRDSLRYATSILSACAQPELVAEFVCGLVWFEATDPRDKVFALHSLMPPHLQGIGFFEADYTKDIVDIYCNWSHTLMCMQEPEALTHLLGIIVNVTLEPNAVFPSWVPRWDINPQPQNVLSLNFKNNQWAASGNKTLPLVTGGVQKVLHIAFGDNVWERAAANGTIPWVTEGDYKSITLGGLRVSTIQQVFHIQGNSINHESLQHLWFAVQQNLNPFKGPGTLKDAFVKTITAERMVLSNKDGRKYSVHDLEVALRDSPLGEKSELLGMADGIPWNFSVFITEDGKIGLGAKIARPGDLVCVLFGGNLPFLLRPMGTSYRLLEQCVVHGIMHGEAVQEMEAGTLHEEHFHLQ